MKIFLLGYMGCGKSRLGKSLADQLGLRFIDLDETIEKKSGKTISEIFASAGEDQFRKAEKETLREEISGDDFVMACGGGTPCHGDNMAIMNEAGITVYLKMSTDALAAQLKDEQDKRPLIKGKNEQELWNYIHESLQQREPDYLKAKYKVKAKDLKAEDLAEFIRLYEMVPGEETGDEEE